MAGASVREADSMAGDMFVGTVDPGLDLPGAMVDVLVAQRAHSASIQAMKVAHQMLRDILDTGDPLA
jgi:flagellar basal body rod protein FlgC